MDCASHLPDHTDLPHQTDLLNRVNKAWGTLLTVSSEENRHRVWNSHFRFAEDGSRCRWSPILQAGQIHLLRRVWRV